QKGEPMTLDELKAEAKRQGYKLIKDNPMPKLIPCICGSKRRIMWHYADGWYFECDKCGRTAYPGRTERKARENWNRMVNDEAD
ncbi:MAG: hypothetical protein II477_00305, partial [Lachnospiraceae bacterium]|nr:hypothetical protein [Lachnospiraceae bacterium]